MHSVHLNSNSSYHKEYPFIRPFVMPLYTSALTGFWFSRSSHRYSSHWNGPLYDFIWFHEFSFAPQLKVSNLQDETSWCERYDNTNFKSRWGSHCNSIESFRNWFIALKRKIIQRKEKKRKFQFYFFIEFGQKKTAVYSFDCESVMDCCCFSIAVKSAWCGFLLWFTTENL